MYDKDLFINGKRADILDEAKNITSNGRKAGEYGKPEDSFQTIARFWSVYLDREIKPADVAVMMILLKVARIKSGTGKKDNWVDIAGYAACGGECEAAGGAGEITMDGNKVILEDGEWKLLRKEKQC